MTVSRPPARTVSPDPSMRAAPPLLLAAAAFAIPGVGDAGGTATSGGCNCTPPPPACCNVAMTHTVKVPGVDVVPPSVRIAPSRILGGVGGEASFEGDISVSVQASASSSAYASSAASSLAAAASSSSAAAQSLGYGSALGVANSQAANLLAASGGGSSFFTESSSNGNIPSLIVAAPAAVTRQVCARSAATAQAVAIQAVCLDDKDVPHPASQVTPGQDVPETYTGELFRCIAGAHMQYVLAPYGGQARFDHGQTVVCGKGEALWRDVGGKLQCRPQAPARDCNERSLLRRYGAGIKILKAAVASQCVEWRTETVQAEAASQGSLQLDGGVGG